MLTVPEGKSVLVVDDGRRYRQLLREVFSDVLPGSPFFSLESGAEAVAHLSRAGQGVPMPDIVLLDRQMPGMDGFETLVRLRAMPALEGVAVIMISGSDDPEHIAAARQAGADFYIPKPPDLDGYEALARRVGDWSPAQGWRAKEIVRVSCGPVGSSGSTAAGGAIHYPPMTVPFALPLPAEIVAASSLINKEPFHVLMACNEAGINLALLTDASCQEDVVCHKRKIFARAMMGFGYANRQIQDYVRLGDAWYEKRRAEVRKLKGLRLAGEH